MKDDPPPLSRIVRGGPRPYRTATRFGARDRFPRQKQRLPLAQLLGLLIERHGLTDECRQQFVCLHWDEIAGPRLAPRTWPIRFAERTLHVETSSSSWNHELQFHKAALVDKINAWVDANRVWLGPPPLVTDIRFELGQRRKQTPIVERDYVQRLRGRQLIRLRRPRATDAPTTSAAESEAIRAETQQIVDPELRALVERVRITWNR